MQIIFFAAFWLYCHQILYRLVAFSFGIFSSTSSHFWRKRDVTPVPKLSEYSQIHARVYKLYTFPYDKCLSIFVLRWPRNHCQVRNKEYMRQLRRLLRRTTVLWHHPSVKTNVLGSRSCVWCRAYCTRTKISRGVRRRRVTIFVSWLCR